MWARLGRNGADWKQGAKYWLGIATKQVKKLHGNQGAFRASVVFAAAGLPPSIEARFDERLAEFRASVRALLEDDAVNVAGYWMFENDAKAIWKRDRLLKYWPGIAVIGNVWKA